jgi:aryl-alcohol dehydrogenase (NADP+)
MQDHYNLIYREEEREMLPLCEDQGIAVIPWSPLARGKLTREPSDLSTSRSTEDKFVSSLYPQEQNDNAVIERVGHVAKQLGVPMAQVALAWVLASDVITAPIVGVTKQHHLDDAIASLDVDLGAEQITQLEEPYRPHEVAGF